MEAREGGEGRRGEEGEAEREEAASANVTGLHSDVGVQRLHRRASCTDVHARAHTLILGVRRPLPARKTVTDLCVARAHVCPYPTPRLAPQMNTCVDEMISRSSCTGVATLRYKEVMNKVLCLFRRTKEFCLQNYLRTHYCILFNHLFFSRYFSLLCDKN